MLLHAPWSFHSEFFAGFYRPFGEAEIGECGGGVFGVGIKGFVCNDVVLRFIGNGK